MKKIISLLLVLATLFSLTACMKSDAAKAVDAMIEALGEISLDSLKAIEEAEAAVEGLSEEDRKQLDNVEMLSSARAAYEEAVDKDLAADIDELIDAIGEVSKDDRKLEETEAARKAYEDAEESVKGFVTKLDVLTAAEESISKIVAAEIDDMIDDIGEVTLDKGEIIDKAIEAMEAAPEQVAGFITKKAELDAAIATLTDLRIKNAEKLINDIGTVTKDSQKKIEAAEAAIKLLSEEDQKKISNIDKMDGMHEQVVSARKAYGKTMLGNFWRQGDAVRNMYFYYPSNIPHNKSYWYTDQRCFALPYMGAQNDSYWLRLIVNYTSRDWVFFEKIIFSVDGKNTTKYFNYFDITRDNSGGKVWEYVDIACGESEIDLLWSIANSKKTIIRFEGDDYYRDHTINAKDKAAIKTMLTAYEHLTAK